MNRRQFLLAAAAAATLPALSFTGRLFAAPVDTPRFLLVFLRGAYDCNNLLVPCASDFYYAARPTLAIARPNAANANSAPSVGSPISSPSRMRLSAHSAAGVSNGAQSGSP